MFAARGATKSGSCSIRQLKKPRKPSRFTTLPAPNALLARELDVSRSVWHHGAGQAQRPKACGHLWSPLPQLLQPMLPNMHFARCLARLRRVPSHGPSASRSSRCQRRPPAQPIPARPFHGRQQKQQRPTGRWIHQLVRSRPRIAGQWEQGRARLVLVLAAASRIALGPFLHLHGPLDGNSTLLHARGESRALGEQL